MSELERYGPLPPVESYISNMIKMDQYNRRHPVRDGEPYSGRWQFQGAVLVGASLERSPQKPGLNWEDTIGFGLGTRYFSPRHLGPFGFGLSMHYWSIDDAANSENFFGFPSLAIRPVREFPIDVSAGPAVGFTEPLSSGEMELTAGGAVQINAGLPVLFAGPYFNADILNINLSLLHRPSNDADPMSGTVLFGINPIGLLNGIFWLTAI